MKISKNVGPGSNSNCIYSVKGCVVFHLKGGPLEVGYLGLNVSPTTNQMCYLKQVIFLF